MYFWLTPELSEAEQCDSRQKKAELSQNNKQIFFNAVQMVHTLFLHESDIYFLKEERVGGGGQNLLLKSSHSTLLNISF